MKDFIEKYKNTYQSFPQISEIKMLWSHDYWDGPLSGVCEVNNKKCWFHCFEDNRDSECNDIISPWYRRFIIHQLTDEQFKAIESDHNKFQRMVGYHTDYTNKENGRRGDFHYNETITKETVDQFYKEAKDTKFPNIAPVSESHIIGWFED